MKLKHRQYSCKCLRALSPASTCNPGVIVQNSSARVQASSSTSHHAEAVCASAGWLVANDVVRV
jgi:hypothetical protein